MSLDHDGLAWRVTRRYAVRGVGGLLRAKIQARRSASAGA